MKTLYININNEPIESNDKLEVLKHDLDGDFFFYLGGKIAGGNIDNEKALVTDFNTESTQSDYRQIIEQWGRVKSILLGEKCEGEFEFTLPDDYIHWLHFDPQYNSIYNNRFANGQSKVITIDLEELYEESVEDLQRKILRRLREDNLSEEIDEIVFNDKTVVRKSPIVSAIKSRYDNIGFKVYKKWLQDNEGVSKDEDNNISDNKTSFDDQNDNYYYAVEISCNRIWSNEETKYKFYNKKGQPLDDKEYYLVAEGDANKLFTRELIYGIHGKTNLLVIPTTVDPTLYYISSNGKLHEIGRYDYENGDRANNESTKEYWKYQALIIQNKYILYRDGLDHTLYEICANTPPRLLSKFQSKINFANSSYPYICRDLLTNGEYTINWKTGELINIPNSRFSIILGYNNDSPIYLIPPKRWDPETDYYKNSSVVDSEGNFLWKFNADTCQVLSNNLLLLDSGKNQVKNLDGKTIINTNDSIDEVKICGYDCLIFDEKIYIISKNKIVNYLYEKVYIIVLNNKVNVYDNQTDELISVFSLKGVYSYGGDGGEECLDMNSDIYIIPFEEWGEQGDIYSISQSKKIYTTIGNERFIGAKNDKFIVEGETYYEIYDNNGTLLKTIEKGEDSVVPPVLHNNGYISWFNVNQNRIEYYDTFLNPYYIDIDNICNISFINVLSERCVIIRSENEDLIFVNNEYVDKSIPLSQFDENNYYGYGDNRDYCVVNSQAGLIKIPNTVIEGYRSSLYMIK